LKRSASKGTRIANQSDAELAEMTANYFGMLSLIDHNVGRIIETLDRQACLKTH
jgi:arylsulfatase A-like enzyme